jgi:hypothetical protein
MRPPRPPGEAGRSHLPLSAMNRAGSPFGELGERAFSRCDRLMHSHGKAMRHRRGERTQRSYPRVVATLRNAAYVNRCSESHGV